MKLLMFSQNAGVSRNVIFSVWHDELEYKVSASGHCSGKLYYVCNEWLLFL